MEEFRKYINVKLHRKAYKRREKMKNQLGHVEPAAPLNHDGERSNRFWL